MTERLVPPRAKRPEFRNINALTDLPTYRLPPAGWVSILHRISGALMFLLMPFIIWMFDTSISSEYSFAKFAAVFNIGIPFSFDLSFGFKPEWGIFSGLIAGWLMKLVALSLIWAYLHHFIAGLRHLWMDVNHAASKGFVKSSALVTLGLGTTLTLILALKLFSVY